MENSELTIKKGYKQTDVGIIPEDWKVKKICEIATIVRGGSPRPAGDPKYFNGSFIPWLTVAALTNIPETQNTVAKTSGFLTEAGSKHSRILEADTLVIANSGFSLGIAKILGIKCCANDGIAALQNFDTNTDKRFVVSYLNTITNHLRKNVAIGNDQPNLNTERIGEISIPHPPLPEQQAIAKVLSDVDALITSLDQLITKKRSIKQGTLQLLLTGKKTENWKEFSLFELADKRKDLFDDGDWIEAEFLTDDGIRLIQTGNIGKGIFLNKENKKYISPESFKLLRCKEVRQGDVLICRLAEPAGRACIMPNLDEEKIITAVDVTIFRPLEILADRRLLVNIFNTDSWFNLINEKCGGSTRTRIARGELGKITIKLPTIEKQKAIAQILSDMDTEIEALETQHDKYKAVKQGMMQELLTGKTRLI